MVPHRLRAPSTVRPQSGHLDRGTWGATPRLSFVEDASPSYFVKGRF